MKKKVIQLEREHKYSLCVNFTSYFEGKLNCNTALMHKGFGADFGVCMGGASSQTRFKQEGRKTLISGNAF